MAGGQQPEESPQEPFVCEFCAEVCPSARALSGHIIKVHIKGKAPAQEPPLPSVPAPALGPGSRMIPPVMPPSSFLPPPVAPAGFSFGGDGLQPRRQLWEPHVQVWRPQARRLPYPVVSGEGGRIRMVLLEPNHAFWAPYRMGMDAPEEIDFMGLRSRPVSPSPSFSSWLNAADME